MRSGLYRNGNMALIAQNERWHFCYLKAPDYQALDTVSFLNEAQTEEMKKNNFSQSPWTDYEACPDALKLDIQKKILKKAEDYRTLLEADACNLVVGWTTDTLTAVPNDPKKRDAILKFIEETMKKGGNGSYLRFNS